MGRHCPEVQIIMYVDEIVFDNCRVDKIEKTPSSMEFIVGTIRDATTLIREARLSAREIDPALSPISIN